MQILELQNNLNIFEYYDNILSLNSVLTVLAEYYLATSILSMAIFYSISPKIQSKKTSKKLKFSLFSLTSFQLNFLSILIIFFYCFLSVKQNFLFLSNFVSMNNALHNDFISLFSKLIIGISCLIYLIFIQQYLRNQKLNYFEYYVLILTSLLGFCLLCCSDDLLTAYLAIELQGLSFYILASFKKGSNYSVESGVKYFILGSFSTIIFLLGINLVYGLSGSISIIDFKDLFIWVFSANSFFLSFESINKALEAFQDKTFKINNDYIKQLQIIFDKFLVLKNKTPLLVSDFDEILTPNQELQFLTFNTNNSLEFSNNIIKPKTNYLEEISLCKGIAGKMLEISNQIDNSSYFYYKEHFNNVKAFNPIVKFAQDLIVDNLLQNSTVWHMNELQNSNSSYETPMHFKDTLLEANSYSEVANKFQYNWFSINDFKNIFNKGFSDFCINVTDNIVFNDINEFVYFNQLSRILDMGLEITEPTDKESFLNITIILEKLKQVGFISISDANFLLIEISKVMMNDINTIDLKIFDIFKEIEQILIHSTNVNLNWTKNCPEFMENYTNTLIVVETLGKDNIFTNIINFLPNSIAVNLAFNETQQINYLKFLILKIKMFQDKFYFTEGEYTFLLNEMSDILTNVKNPDKQKLYFELLETLNSIVPYYQDLIMSNLVNIKNPDNIYSRLAEARKLLGIYELSLFYLSLQELINESSTKTDLMTKALTDIYSNENIYFSYSKPVKSLIAGLDNSIISNNSITNGSAFYNISSEHETYVLSIAHILILFSFFVQFSYNSDFNSNYMFDNSCIELGLLIILLGLFFKLALSPFHLWSPDIYEGSPSSTTFFFTVVSKLSIFVLLLKICYIGFYSFITDWQFYALFVAVLSILVGSIGGLKQRKFKSLLAYSSISNMGLILVSFSAGNFEGIKAVFYYFIIYILSGLSIWSIFFLLKLKKNITSEKHNKDLGDFSLLQESNVILSYASIITIFTVAGIPPMVGFLAKVSIFLTLTEASMYFIAVISIVSSVISTFYYIRILKVIFFENVLVGKLFYPTKSKDNIVRSILFFLMLFLFISPVLINFSSYKITLFLSKNFY